MTGISWATSARSVSKSAASKAFWTWRWTSFDESVRASYLIAKFYSFKFELRILRNCLFSEKIPETGHEQLQANSRRCQQLGPHSRAPPNQKWKIARLHPEHRFARATKFLILAQHLQAFASHRRCLSRDGLKLYWYKSSFYRTLKR